jgi:general secretion pathway protein J
MNAYWHDGSLPPSRRLKKASGRRVQHSCRQSGFTLLEVLIASTLMMVMMTLLLGRLRMASGSWSAGDKQSEQLSRLLVTQNFLRAQLSAMRPLIRLKTSMELSNGPPGLYFRGGEDWIEYAAALPPQVHGGVYVLRIFIEKQENDKRLMISIRPAAAGDDTANAGPQSIDDVVLLDHVRSLKFSYFDKSDQDTPWSSSWIGKAVLPWLIKIQIADGTGIWPEMVIAPQIRAKM